MRPKRTKHIDQQERAIEQLCDGLRGLRARGIKWPLIREHALRIIKVMQGEEMDEAKKRAIVRAAEKSSRKRKVKRKPSSKFKGVKPMEDKCFTR